MDMNKIKCSAANRNLLLSFIINAVLLGVFLCFFTPYYESNDDFLISNFVNGAISEKSSRLIFVNIIIGTLLKGLYTLVPSAPWYALFQYAMLFASFTAIAWILLQRYERAPALLLTIGTISVFGLDAYICLQFTKTTAVATVSGIMLMFYSLGKEKGTKCRRLPMTIGIILALLGGMFRYHEFLMAGAVICWIIIDPLTDVAKLNVEAKNKLHRFFDTIKPFVLLLLLFGAVRVIDNAAYRDTEWAEYKEYSKARVQVLDHGTPSYDMYEDGYKALGISRDFFTRIYTWNFYDPDKFDTETFYNIAALRGERKLIGGDTAVIDFFPICAPTLIREWCFAGLVLIAAVWLLFGRHDLRAIISILLSASVCLCLFIYFFLSERWGVYRVDYGIILALAVVILWYIPGGKTHKWQISTAAILIFTIALQCIYMSEWKDSFTYYRDNKENIAKQREAIQTLTDDGHLIMQDSCILILSKDFYSSQSPFGSAIPGSADKLVTMGGWHITPDTVRNLSQYGVRNPYKDIVNNSEVYLQTQFIDSFLSCIREYVPDAEATLIEPLSSQTGLSVYSITAK